VKPLLALFDVDGTLLLTQDPLSSEALLPTFRQVYRVEAPADAVKRTLDRTVAAGDTPRDVSGAHAAGIRAIRVKPDEDLNEVADVLIAWNRRP
jgi:FMN phosphatase YigB (HAD superfamily)